MLYGPEKVQATWGVAWDSGPLECRTKMVMKVVDEWSKRVVEFAAMWLSSPKASASYP